MLYELLRIKREANLPVMRYLPYHRAIVAALLIQSCQSQLNALKEEAPAASSSKSGMYETASSEVLTTLSETLPCTSAHSARNTPSHTPLAPTKQQAKATTASSYSPSPAISPLPAAAHTLLIPPSTPQLTANLSATHAAQLGNTPSHVFSRIFTPASGERVKFIELDGQCKAELQAAPNAYPPQRILPVVSLSAIGPQLSWLQGQSLDLESPD